jgi:hypothetical protein
MDAGPKVATTLLLMLVSWSVHAVSGADRWQSLRDNNPFQPYQPPAPVVEPPPPNLEGSKGKSKGVRKSKGGSQKGSGCGY